MSRRRSALAAALLVLALAGAARAQPWYVTLHAGEVGYDLARAGEALDRARALGVQGVRTDVFWHDVEPERDRRGEARLAFYRGYVAEARARGLDVLVILCGPPGWAVELYERDPAAFLDEAQDYARDAAAALDVARYQLWNEPNHPLLCPVRAEHDGALLLRLAAGVRAASPRATTLVNVMSDLPGWRNAVTRWLEEAGPAIDVVGIDHYPGTWTLGSDRDWAPLDWLVARLREGAGPWRGKRGAVLETGVSGWGPRDGEARQVRWLERSLPALRARLAAPGGERIELLGYYQLVDAAGAPGPEACFGLLRADLSPKPAFEALRLALLDFPR